MAKIGLRAMVALVTRRSVLAAMSAGAATAALAQPDSHSLTFTIEDELLHFPGAVDGHPVTVMLDSGAGAVFIDSSFARRIGLVANGETVSAGGFTAAQTVDLSKPFKLSFGGVSMDIRSAALVDLSPIRQTGGVIPVIVGRDFFDSFGVEIDFPARRLTLHRPGAFDARGARREVLRRETGGTHSLQIAIEGHDPVWAGFDLGSNTALYLDGGYARTIGLLDDRPVSTWISSQLEGIVTYDVATVRTVRIAGVDIGHAPLNSTPSWRKENEVTANIGFPLISRLGKIIIDYQSEALFVFPGPSSSEPFSKDRLGLAMSPRENGGWRVVHVAPRSPGALGGWKAGDEIAAINGQASMTVEQRRAITGGAPGAKVSLDREGGKTSTLILADYF